MRRIVKVQIIDTLGTRNITFSPGSVTIIRGANGTGKSSILGALRSVFQGGSDPSLIRNGAAKSVVEFRLDDGTVVTKTTAPIKPRKGEPENAEKRYSTSLEILNPDGTPRNAPQSYIESLSESIAVDPGEILRIDTTTKPGRKQLADILMRIMPISFEPDAVKNACMYRSKSALPPGEEDTLAMPVPAVALDLDGLKKFGNQVGELRRRTGQTLSDAGGAVNRLFQSLPEDDGRDYAKELAAEEDRRREIEAAIADATREIEVQKIDALALLAKSDADAIKVIDDDINAKIAALEKERVARCGKVRDDSDARRVQIGDLVAQEYARLGDESKPVLEASIAAISSLKEKLASAQRAVTLKQELDIQQATAKEAGWKYDELTRVLDRIEKLRKDKLDSLPVAGLEVSGEQVLVDGNQWANVNTARKVEIALQLCALRAGELGFLLVDNFEAIDQENARALEEGIAASGYQMICAQVSEGPLTIDVLEPVAA